MLCILSQELAPRLFCSVPDVVLHTMSLPFILYSSDLVSFLLSKSEEQLGLDPRSGLSPPRLGLEFLFPLRPHFNLCLSLF